MLHFVFITSSYAIHPVYICYSIWYESSSIFFLNILDKILIVAVTRGQSTIKNACMCMCMHDYNLSSKTH